MKAVIFDDDKNFSQMLTDKIRHYCDLIKLEMSVESVQSAEELLFSDRHYDVYFLDIEMPHLSGFDMVRRIRMFHKDSEFIFVSSHEECIMKSFHVKPIAFVRKRKLDKDLALALKFLVEIAEERVCVIALPVGKKKINISPDQILFCQSEDHYVNIHYVNDVREFYRLDMKSMEETLKKFRFIRCHSRYLVNMHYIEKLNHMTIILDNAFEIPVSRTYREHVMEELMDWFYKRKGIG